MTIDINSLLAIYSGTFDPIHYGHLKPVETLAHLINLRQIIIVPDNTPPHRPNPIGTSEQRKHMIELAISNNPLFVVYNAYKLHRNKPSYTSYILRKWRSENGPKRPLALIIGQDSLLNLPSWHQYATILENAHLIVCRRLNYPIAMKEKKQQDWLYSHLTYNKYDLHKLPAGKIYLAKTPWVNISGTLIRNRLQNNLSCNDLLPPSVLKYISEQKLYHYSTN